MKVRKNDQRGKEMEDSNILEAQRVLRKSKRPTNSARAFRERERGKLIGSHYN